MASFSSVFCSDFSLEHEKPDNESTRAIVNSINEYILELLVDVESWNSIKSKCISKLNVQRQEAFQINEHSVLSNLYWGIQTIEATLGVKCSDERDDRLRNSERMLQVPALIDEHGVTGGIHNHYLVSCSYFYLSVVSKLQGNNLQVAQHFLQAILVSPGLILTEFVTPRLCQVLFPSSSLYEIEEVITADEAVRRATRKYKHWLMYYQIMFTRAAPPMSCASGNMSNGGEGLQFNLQEVFENGKSLKSIDEEHYLKYEKGHPPGPQRYAMDDAATEHKVSTAIQEFQIHSEAPKQLHEVSGLKSWNIKPENYRRTKRLQEVLMERQSVDTPTSVSSSYSYFLEESDVEGNMDNIAIPARLGRTIEDYLAAESCFQNLQDPYSTLDSMYNTVIIPHDHKDSLTKECPKEDINNLLNSKFFGPTEGMKCNLLETKTDQRQCGGEFFDQVSKIAWHKHQQKRVKRETRKDYGLRELDELYFHPEEEANTELLYILEKAISKLCFSEGLAESEQDYDVEVTNIYKLLSDKKGLKYAMVRDVILDQLLAGISSSKEDKVIKASVSILATIISVNKSAVEEIKKKGLQLVDLATALKRNVHEAAVIIYLINPAPVEIKTLGLLPALVEVVCASNSCKEKIESHFLTPPAASLMIIEVLVTAFDYATNNMHLAAINSPRVLFALIDVAKCSNVEEYTCLANILVKCMQFDGKCRKVILQFASVASFTCLLESDEERAKYKGLEFFHEILHLPRSTAISILTQMRIERSANTSQLLVHCFQRLEPHYKVLAADIWLQMDTLENLSCKSSFRKEAIEIILQSLASEYGSIRQQLSAFILGNIGGTYSWTGTPSTIALLLRKAGLTSLYHRNQIKDIDWLDQNLQDACIEAWSKRIARSIIDAGEPVFQALAKALRSRTKPVSRNSLAAVAWIGCEIARYPNRLRSAACEILLPALEQFLHPGCELEERLLACLSIYNYASGKGMQKLVHFSEGVRESLRRLSSVTWMAEELHRVAEFYLPNKSRISCVHTQILEAKCNGGAVTALIYYGGFLCSGHSDGSIKLWEMSQQSAKLLYNAKEHKKAVTCFSLLEAGESLVSGSSDKTIRVWQMVQRKLECVEEITTKEPISKLQTIGEMIFLLTEGHKLKMLDSSRRVNDVGNTRKVKCMSVIQGKIYMGCKDSSIQEMVITSNKEKEIKAPTKSWRLQNKAINSVVGYKDWLYCGSSVVEGSKLKEWRTNFRPQMSVVPDKSGHVLAMEVVEDFIYVTCSNSSSNLQIWLRGTQQKVGRVSAGSKITSLLTANDIVLCGTEKGLIKGWIPL